MIRLLFSFFSGVQKSFGLQLAKVMVATLAILSFSASGFMYFELAGKPDLAWADAIWWAVVTVTTVGYGDYFPATFGGRYIVAIPTMIVGISILGYLLSTVATFLIETRSKELKGMGKVNFKDHILVIHHQSLARSLEIVNELQSDPKTKDAPIVLIDNGLDEIPEVLSQLDVRFVKGDPTKEATLERANFKDAKYAVVLSRDPRDPASDDHTLAVALTLEHLNVGIVTVAECLDPERVNLMRKSGCDSVVCVAQLSSRIMIQEVLDPGVQHVMKELTSTTFGQQIFVVNVEDSQGFVFEKAASTLSAKGYLALGIQRENDVLLNPSAEERVGGTDSIICLGDTRPAPIRIG